MATEPLTIKDLAPLIAGLAGVLVGGLIAEFHIVIQGVRERTRALRKLLYKLLELRYELRRRDPTTALNALQRYFRERFGQQVADGVGQFFQYKPVLELIEAATRGRSREEFESGYQQAVDEVAPFRPLLAYQLSGQSALLEADRLLREYYGKVVSLPELQGNADMEVAMSRAEKYFERLAYGQAVQRMERDIVWVAWNISPWTWIRVLRLLRRADSRAAEDISRLMDTYLREVAPIAASTQARN